MFDFEFSECNEFSVGNPWNLTSHQWRRSLVIYMNRSGLVEYGAIKRQLKHANIDMTLYYGNGARRMDEFDINKLNENELSTDYKKEQPFLECLSFMEHIHDGDLNHGNMGKISSSNPIVYQSIEKTLEQFTSGRLRFKSTPLGGCSSTEECNEKLHCSFIACLKCDSAIIKTKKLEKVIILTEDELKNIKSNPCIVNSVTKTLEGDLKIMKKALGHYKALEELS